MSIWSWVKTQPALFFALLGAVISVLASFGLALSVPQITAVTALVQIGVGVVTRQVVWPDAHVQELLPPVVYSSDVKGPK